METNEAVLTKSSRVFDGMFEDEEYRNRSISTRIKYFMKKEKLSQPKLGAAIGCSRDTIFSYANAKIPEAHMNIQLLKKMALYFGVEEYYFCNEYHRFVDTTNVCEYLKRIRENNGMTQRQFVEILNVPLSSYKCYEVGKMKISEEAYHKLKKIEHTFGL